MYQGSRDAPTAEGFRRQTTPHDAPFAAKDLGWASMAGRVQRFGPSDLRRVGLLLFVLRRCPVPNEYCVHLKF